MHTGTITCTVLGAALSKQVIPTRNIADDFHAQGQVDSEQNMVSEPAGSTVHEKVEKQRSQTHVYNRRRKQGALSPHP